jgi:hypothetical protein
MLERIGRTALVVAAALVLSGTRASSLEAQGPCWKCQLILSAWTCVHADINDRPNFSSCTIGFDGYCDFGSPCQPTFLETVDAGGGIVTQGTYDLLSFGQPQESKADFFAEMVFRAAPVAKGMSWRTNCQGHVVARFISEADASNLEQSMRVITL